MTGALRLISSKNNTFSLLQPQLHPGLWCSLRKGSCKCSGSLRWPGWQGPITEFVSFATFFVFVFVSPADKVQHLILHPLTFSKSREFSRRLCSTHSISPNVLSSKGFPRLMFEHSLFWSHRLAVYHQFVLCQRKQLFLTLAYHIQGKKAHVRYSPNYAYNELM